MGRIVSLAVGDRYELIDLGVTIEIVELMPEISFYVAGPGVKNPETARVMPCSAFAAWLTAERARKIRKRGVLGE